jgi:hypothetical protein
VILGLLAVETPGNVAAVVVGQRDAGSGGQRDALVGGAEQNIEADAAGADVNSPALKKYGLERPDFSVKSPKRSTPARMAKSMNSCW